MKKLLMLLFVGVAFAAPAFAADGSALYTEKGCNACHGEGGKSSVNIYPNLAGQRADYVFAQATAIRDGKRTNGGAAAMTALVATVSDEEFHAIADYLSGL